MNVIGRAARRKKFDPKILGDAIEIGVEAFLERGRNAISPIFSAEDAVHEVCGVALGHESMVS